MSSPPVARALTELRQSRGLSLSRLAALSGVSKSSLSTWESGRHTPQDAPLRSILEALDATPDERLRIYERMGRPASWHGLGLAGSLPKSTFAADALTGLRFRTGISQAELSHRLGTSQATISRWESGDAAPSEESASNLATAFGVPVAEVQALFGANHFTVPIEEFRTPPDMSELFPEDEEEPESVAALRKLAAYHAVTRRSRIDRRWEELELDLSVAYCTAVMDLLRDKEFYRFTRMVTDRFIPSRASDPRGHYLMVCRLVSRRRAVKRMDRKDVQTFLRLSDWSRSQTDLWCLASAGGVAGLAGEMEASESIFRRCEQVMHRTERVYCMPTMVAQYYRRLGKPQRSLEFMLTFWDRVFAETDPTDPCSAQPYFQVGLAYAELGLRSEALTMIEKGDQFVRDRTTQANAERVAKAFVFETGFRRKHGFL